MQKETVKVSDVVYAEIIGKNEDNKSRKGAEAKAADSDPDLGDREDGVVGGEIRPDNPA